MIPGDRGTLEHALAAHNELLAAHAQYLKQHDESLQEHDRAIQEQRRDHERAIQEHELFMRESERAIQELKLEHERSRQEHERSRQEHERSRQEHQRKMDWLDARIKHAVRLAVREARAERLRRQQANAEFDEKMTQIAAAQLINEEELAKLKATMSSFLESMRRGGNGHTQA